MKCTLTDKRLGILYAVAGIIDLAAGSFLLAAYRARDWSGRRVVGVGGLIGGILLLLAGLGFGYFSRRYLKRHLNNVRTLGDIGHPPGRNPHVSQGNFTTLIYHTALESACGKLDLTSHRATCVCKRLSSLFMPAPSNAFVYPLAFETVLHLVQTVSRLPQQSTTPKTLQDLAFTETPTAHSNLSKFSSIVDMPSERSVIVIPDDDSKSQSPDTIVLDSDDDWEHIAAEQDNDVDNEDDVDDGLECLGGTTAELRTISLPAGSMPVDYVIRQDIAVIPRMVIAFGSDSFFRIEALFKSPSGEHFASGYTLVHNRNVNNYLPKKTNEVALHAWVTDTYEDVPLCQYQTIVSLPLVIVVRKCIFTNQPFPERSYRQDASKVGPAHKAFAEQHCHLTCRRKVLYKVDTEHDRVSELVIENLSAAHVRMLGDDSYPDDELREWYIGQTRAEQRVAAYKRQIKQSLQCGGRSFEADVQRDFANLPIDSHVNSYGDICAGAGGTTRGADSAGLNIRFMLDHATHMIESLKRNFSSPDVDIRQQEIFQFCSSQAPASMPVDVLHISFPCCAHSYLNQGGRNDQDNIDVGYSVESLLAISRPLIVTFEQVPGIMTKRGGENYENLIHQLTSCGFSVRARVVKMSDYGHSTQRRRLIIFASCPGQSLPSLPQPTHGPGKRPLATIAEVLAQLDYSTIPSHMRACKARNGPSYNPNCQMRNTFTGAGSLDLHFSGTRTWMLAEAAVLQGFPPCHQFYGTKTSIMKQIGNAVPPVAAEVLFRHIREHLQRTDDAFATKDFVDLT